MRTIITYIIIIAGCFTIASEATPRDKKIKTEKPDMEAIKSEVNNPESKYYYPELMKRYEANETIMGLQDYRHLYLGYVFQEDYDPYRRSEFSKNIEEQYYKDKHTKAECDTIIKYAELSLKDNPFDLRQINFLIYALREKKKNNIANIWQYRLNHLLEAIISTGTGLDKENAWYVINPQHEYNIINFQGNIAISQEFIPPYYDFISVNKKNEKDPEGYFFNIKHIIEEYNRKFPCQ